LTGLTAVAASATTPAQVCQSTKNKLAGKYDYCRQKAEAKYATTADGAARTLALQKCLDKYNLKWPLAESKAIAAGGACPSAGDQAVIQNATDGCTTNIATALAGGTLQDCPADLATCQGDLSTAQSDLSTCQGDLSTCDADLTACQASQQYFPATGQTTCWNSSGSVISCAGTGHDGEIQAGATLAYTDNGDGTVTDNNTNLMWEKLSQDGSIHDWVTTYTWDNAFAVKVAALNSGSFAGHTDWRVPNLKELQSIVNYENVTPAISPAFNTGCTAGCTVTTCSCTLSGAYYWSSSTYAPNPQWAWVVNFYDGTMGAVYKTPNFFLRAVRGGS
jgi:hypothetical protein